MEVFQCPRCSLRFRFATELRDHLGHDHPQFSATPRSVEDDLLDACHCHHAGPRAGRLDAPSAATNAV